MQYRRDHNDGLQNIPSSLLVGGLMFSNCIVTQYILTTRRKWPCRITQLLVSFTCQLNEGYVLYRAARLVGEGENGETTLTRWERVETGEGAAAEGSVHVAVCLGEGGCQAVDGPFVVIPARTDTTCRLTPKMLHHKGLYWHPITQKPL